MLKMLSILDFSVVSVINAIKKSKTTLPNVYAVTRKGFRGQTTQPKSYSVKFCIRRAQRAAFSSNLTSLSSIDIAHQTTASQLNSHLHT